MRLLRCEDTGFHASPGTNDSLSRFCARILMTSPHSPWHLSVIENAGCAPAIPLRWKEQRMHIRSRFLDSRSPEERMADEARDLRERAEELLPGLQRELLLRQARQDEVASHLAEWLTSPGLQS